MGCSASKASEVIVAPMPLNPKHAQENSICGKKGVDSLRGSQASISSNSTRIDRENSARSTRTTLTTDSGVGELEEERKTIITESSTEEEIFNSKASDRPGTPELSIYGTQLKSKKSLKQRLFEEKASINNTSLLRSVKTIEHPMSRGSLAFNVMLDTRNVKNRPIKLASLEKRKKRSKRRTKEEIEHKMKEANERRKEHANQVIEKTLSHKEKQLCRAKTLDYFCQKASAATTMKNHCQ